MLAGYLGYFLGLMNVLSEWNAFICRRPTVATKVKVTEIDSVQSQICFSLPWTEEPVDYSPWGRKESDMTEHFTSLQIQLMVRMSQEVMVGWKCVGSASDASSSTPTELISSRHHTPRVPKGSHSQVFTPNDFRQLRDVPC